MKMKSQTITFLVAFVIFVLTAGMMFLYSRQAKDDPDPFAVDPTQEIERQGEERYLDLPEEEEEEIASWIEENDLNKYGDPQDTNYIGGTPLFNEETGEYQERYDYLVANHQDKPWLTSLDQEEESEETQESDDQEESETEEEQDDSDVEDPDSSEEEEESQQNPEQDRDEPMSFSEVEDWQTLVRTNYQMEYPDFAQLDSQEYPIKITGAKNFAFTVYRQAEEPEGECEQAVNFGEDAVYLCHNQEPLYQSVYQRMEDSFFVQ